MPSLLEANQLLTDLAVLVDTTEGTTDVIPDIDKIISVLNEITASIQQGGVTVREAFVSRNAYMYICKAWSLCCWSGTPDVLSPAESSIPARNAVMKALYSLTAGFPEIVDDVGWQIIAQAVDNTVSDETQILMLKLVRNVCVESEENRERICSTLGLIHPLTELIIRDNPSSEYMREWCATIKSLLLSDDPRVPYNRASERKSEIAKCKVIPILAAHLSNPNFEEDEGSLNAIVIILGTMAINEDLCIQIDSGNVLTGLNNCMKQHFRSKILLRNCVALLRYLCCHEEIREKANGYPFMKWALEAVYYYKREPDVIDITICCLGFMTLRNACQTTTFLNRNGLQLVKNAMSENLGDSSILKASCFLLRNVCENCSSEDKTQFWELDYPALFKHMLKQVPELKEFYLMPVLKELGLTDLCNQTPEEILGEDDEEELELEAIENDDLNAGMYSFMTRMPSGDRGEDELMSRLGF